MRETIKYTVTLALALSTSGFCSGVPHRDHRNFTYCKKFAPAFHSFAREGLNLSQSLSISKLKVAPSWSFGRHQDNSGMLVGWSGELPPATIFDGLFSSLNSKINNCAFQIDDDSQNSNGDNLISVRGIYFSKKSDHVIFYYEIQSHDIGSHVALVYMTRLGSEWHIAGRKMLVIS
jgi:hypothetical protein